MKSNRFYTREGSQAPRPTGGGGCSKGPGRTGPELKSNLDTNEPSAHHHRLPPHGLNYAADPTAAWGEGSGTRRGSINATLPPREQHVPCSTLGPPAQGTKAPPPPGESNAIFCFPPSLPAPRDPLSPSMAFAPWVGSQAGVWAGAMDSPLCQERERGNKAGLGF